MLKREMLIEDLTPETFENAGIPRRMDDETASLLRNSLAELRRRCPNEPTERLGLFTDRFIANESVPVHPYQGPAYWPGLRALPFWDVTDVPAFARIEGALAENKATLAEEVRSNFDTNALRTYHSSVRYPQLREASWTGCTLIDGGALVTDLGRERFPKTIEILQAFLPETIGEVSYLRLAPGVQIPWHFDSNNIEITCHFGVIVPPGCEIQVGLDRRPVVEGKAYFFDHSIVHSAWNASAESDRVVLVMDLIHPDLTPFERSVVKDMAARLLDG